jgi:transcriptional regulator with XRE-family HTH domain
VTGQEFGRAVRQLRERTSPESLGLPTVGARRTAGLRREELGDIAGMSADYVRRLEQGRSHPSPGVVSAIARALRVGRADYERLCALAGYAAADGDVPTTLGPGATRLMERFAGTPMCVADAAMNLHAVNGAFLTLDHWDLTGSRWDWNIAWRAFCDPLDRFRQSAPDATDHEAVLVSQLRAAMLRYPTDASLGALIDEIRTKSALFDGLWRNPRKIVAYESSADFTRRDGRSLTLTGNVLTIPGEELSAVMLTAAHGSDDEARLREVVEEASGPTVVRVGQHGPG